MWNGADSLIRVYLNIGLIEEETISDIYEINFIGQERKIFGVSLRKNGKRELVIANNDYNFEEHFYKIVQNGSYIEG